MLRVSRYGLASTMMGQDHISQSGSQSGGVDAILGKAYRKLYARIYSRCTDSEWAEADDQEIIDVTCTPASEADKPTSLDDVAEKINEGAKPEEKKQPAPTTDNPDEPSADELWLMNLQLQTDELDTIGKLNDKRRDATTEKPALQPAIDDIIDSRIGKIRASRGERTNVK